MTVTAGETYDITCVAYGARPPAVLEWCLPDDVVVVLQNQSDVVRDYSFISHKVVNITPSTNDQGKGLRCLVSHRELQTYRQHLVYLNIQGEENTSSTKRTNLFSKPAVLSL